jgi:hypothetical protein
VRNPPEDKGRLGRQPRTEKLLETLDRLVARHGEMDAARILSNQLTPAEARAYARPFVLALARRTNINDGEDGTDA